MPKGESILSYWTEGISIGEFNYDVTFASTAKGLCWLGIGKQSEEEEQDFKLWAGRWFSGWEVIRSVEPNAQAILEIKEYFQKKRELFTVELHQIGTPFQLRVWKELLNIPFGQTLSYGELAERVGCIKGQRAVGLANSKNPIGIIVPCHRVIGKDGSLTGYAGGIELKRKLLELEKF